MGSGTSNKIIGNDFFKPYIKKGWAGLRYERDTGKMELKFAPKKKLLEEGLFDVHRCRIFVNTPL